MIHVIATGMTGLVGTRVSEILTKDSCIFDHLSRSRGFDLLKPELLYDYIVKSDSPWVFHFAAFTDVDEAEKDKDNGKDGLVWKLNVTATEAVCRACKDTSKRLIYISTDYVFDGKKDIYEEHDKAHPISWYGETKFHGEQAVRSIVGEKGIIIRISYPYGQFFSVKQDFVWKIKSLLETKKTIQTPTDQIITPTYIDDVAYAILSLMKQEKGGTYHVAGSQSLTPYMIAEDVVKAWNLTGVTIYPASFSSFFEGRAPRPFHAVLSNATITRLGVRMRSFDDGLHAIVHLGGNQ